MPYDYYGITPEEIAADIIELAGSDLTKALEIRNEIRELETNIHI